VQPKTNVCK